MRSKAIHPLLTLGSLLGLLVLLVIRAFREMTHRVEHPPEYPTDQEANDRAGDGPLVEAERRWSERAPHSYSFILREQCFCPPRRGLEVTVRDGAIVRSRPVSTAGEDSNLLPSEPLPQARSIPDLFAEIREAVGDPDWGVRAVYDSTWGFPVSFSTGHYSITDIGRGVSVSEFRPLAR